MVPRIVFGPSYLSLGPRTVKGPTKLRSVAERKPNFHREYPINAQVPVLSGEINITFDRKSVPELNKCLQDHPVFFLCDSGAA